MATEPILHPDAESKTPSRGTETPPGPWPWFTLALLVVGYAGYYLCRSDLSVARPLILDSYKWMKKSDIGFITSTATMIYALGKFIFGSMSDTFGGKKLFLFGMIGAVAATVIFGLGGPPLFLAAWCLNRFVQSAGWGGMVKITSRWFGSSSYGKAMGIVSLSFLFGDFVSRKVLSMLIKAGWPWESIFMFSAATLAVIAVPIFILLRDAPSQRGLPEPTASDAALVDGDAGKRPIGELLRPLLTSSRFWTVCALSFGFTFMRETFNDWTPTYLHEVAKLSEGDAADASSYFPLFGGFSVIAVGYLADRFGRLGRGAILTVGLALGTVGLLALGLVKFENPTVLVATVAAIAFVLIGPYSLLAGAISLDFGGKAASASASGWIDGVGYIGGILSGQMIAKIAEDHGWATAFLVLAAVSAVSAIIAAVHLIREKAAMAAVPAVA